MISNRRDVLRAGAIIASGGILNATSLLPGARAQSCDGGAPPGAQLFTVRKLLAEDPRATLQALGEIGIEEIEVSLFNDMPDSATAFYGLSVDEFGQAIADAGLSSPMAHIDRSLNDLELAAERAHALNVRGVVTAVGEIFVGEKDGSFDMVGAASLDQIDRLADKLNKTGRRFQTLGLSFAYHNHHVEFIPVAGNIPFDYLMERTDPQLVKLEFDVAWLSVGGVDPVEYLHRYADRAVSCHLKDYDTSIAIPKDSGFLDIARAVIVEPGAGSVDFASVLGAIDEAGIEHAFIEVDMHDDPLAAIDSGNKYLRSLRSC